MRENRFDAVTTHGENTDLHVVVQLLASLPIKSVSCPDRDLRHCVAEWMHRSC